MRETRLLLTELSRVHLVNEHALGRDALHDLRRAYAVELAYAQHGEAERREAVNRLFEHYLCANTICTRRTASGGPLSTGALAECPHLPHLLTELARPDAERVHVRLQQLGEPRGLA
ncbi:hypothetical protein [Streptomyces avermitilis]|uniref:hypothetical protein n=1 Tax=Streptomyces avermitilis TaxID=33903 RepID=UPI003829C45B